MENPRRSTLLAEAEFSRSSKANHVPPTEPNSSTSGEPTSSLALNGKLDFFTPRLTLHLRDRTFRRDSNGTNLQSIRQAFKSLRFPENAMMEVLKSTQDTRFGKDSKNPIDSNEFSEMEESTYIEMLPLESKRGKKRMKDSDAFGNSCLLAATDHTACALSLIELADGNLNTMVEFATRLIEGPVGHIGSRRELRAAAVLVLDKVLNENGNHLSALCVKGEMLLPRDLLGSSPLQTPYSIVEAAYAYFCKADLLGSREGRFLRGRWLVMMTDLHKNVHKTIEGMRYVKEAAVSGNSRAIIFIGQVHEFPGKFGWGEGPPSDIGMEKAVELYKTASGMGNAEALNNMGRCYASGLGGLSYDFDKAVCYYVLSIKAGGLMGFENLGSLYETGMAGEAPHRIDYDRALFYYKQGAKRRCIRSAYNLALAYSEGLGNIVDRDLTAHEKCLKYCILLAHDDSDVAMMEMVKKKLISLFMFQMIISDPDSEIVPLVMRKLKMWMNEQAILVTVDRLNNCLAYAVKNDNDIECQALLGISNGLLAFEVAKRVASQDSRRSDIVDVEAEQRMIHLFGSYIGVVRGSSMGDGRFKRRRIINE